MKSISKALAPISVLALIGLPSLAQRGGGGHGAGRGGRGGNGGSGNVMVLDYIETLPLEMVDAQEYADLMHMRQEEKLARDVYLTLYQVWKVKAFDNIARAEQAHMNLTLVLLDRYGLPDPLTSDEIGVFPDPGFADLYRWVVDFGMRSQLHAVATGALIEDLDIYDLDLALANTDNRDIAMVWQNLSRGSRNHLRAFYGLVLDRGFQYPGHWLLTSRILDIVTAPVEKQPVDENGSVLP